MRRDCRSWPIVRWAVCESHLLTMTDNTNRAFLFINISVFNISVPTLSNSLHVKCGCRELRGYRVMQSCPMLRC